MRYEMNQVPQGPNFVPDVHPVSPGNIEKGKAIAARTVLSVAVMTVILAAFQVNDFASASLHNAYAFMLGFFSK